MTRPAGHALGRLRQLPIDYAQPSPECAAPAYDGVGEDWFESPEAMKAAFAGPEGQAVMADTGRAGPLDRASRVVCRGLDERGGEGMLRRIRGWRCRRRQRLIELGDQRLIRGVEGVTYDNYGYQP
ncbi:MAG: EthD domain-containing protein [Mycobacterium leprae]